MNSSGKGESVQYGKSIPLTVSGEHVKFGSPSHVDQGVVIGSGSVVTKDIPPYTVVTGNPARILRKTKEWKCKSGLRDFPYAHP
jgi:bifunctional N-acetylglucosamine-1-phosphate-uridyltransferase/glucosamine-1-phosphate-acetyltransferase GlmU-like protein